MTNIKENCALVCESLDSQSFHYQNKCELSVMIVDLCLSETQRGRYSVMKNL